MKLKLPKNMTEKKLFIIGASIIILLGIIITAIIFFKKDEEPEPVKVKDDPVKVEEPIIDKKLTIVDEASTSRPYAVMINNINIARPLQSGLQDAYLIYEIIAEGGISRYLALFLDQNTGRIGSVRSARHYFLDYALENDAIYVHHGQSPQAAADFTALGVDRIVVDNSTTGWRDKTLNVSSEHTLFTSIEKLNKGLGNKRTTRNKDLLLKYSVDELDLANIANATTATNVTIKYSSSCITSYTYDSEHKYYLRSVNGKEHLDYESKEQLHFKNIIVYQVKNYTLADAENKGRQGLENTGSGKGYYISNGVSIPIYWQKNSRSEQTKYTLENGEELKVNDGNTFIQIQPLGQTLEISG